MSQFNIHAAKAHLSEKEITVFLRAFSAEDKASEIINIKSDENGWCINVKNFSSALLLKNKICETLLNISKNSYEDKITVSLNFVDDETSLDESTSISIPQQIVEKFLVPFSPKEAIGIILSSTDTLYGQLLNPTSSTQFLKLLEHLYSSSRKETIGTFLSSTNTSYSQVLSQLANLHPEVAKAIVITSGIGENRPSHQYLGLYGRGYSTPNTIVTNTPPSVENEDLYEGNEENINSNGLH